MANIEIPKLPESQKPDLGAAQEERIVPEPNEAVAGAIEGIVAEIWAEVLNRKQVTPQDNFFELGGGSLLAAQVALRLWQRLGVESGIREVFGNPVLSDFARVVETAWCSQTPAIAGEMGKDAGQVADSEPLLEEAGRKIVYEWNETAGEIPGRCVHELFEEEAERRPDAAALISGKETVSYGELNRRANRLAHSLRRLGVEPGTRAAILLERSLDLVVAQLAILKCGAAYVPLDPAFPSERICFMVRDSMANTLVSLSRMEAPDVPRVLRVNVDQLSVPDKPAEKLPNPDAKAMAYFMYTSGSTGQPKGVIVPHRAITSLVVNNGFLRFEPTDRVAFAANPTFDAATLEVWGPLLNGSSMVVIDQQTLLDSARFGEALQQAEVTCLWLTVGLFNQYAESLSECLPGLRYLIIGGDILEPKIVARTLRRNAPRHLLNGYGPTETTTFAATYEINSVPEGATSIPIGRAIANRRIYVLDTNQEPVAQGVIGELYIGGDGVACGYWNRPELTAERFMSDPFALEEGARMYRTGDLGRWNAGGNIEFFGRNDCQVKLRGFRIELGEIEARLAEYPGVREAVVVVREETPGDKRLVAYYALSQSGLERNALPVEQVRAHMSAKLPEYMVPAAYVRMESFPLTANGKLDRKALPAPTADAYGNRSYEPLLNEMEERVAKIWAEVLNLERVGRHDNFFGLGGHSLCAITLVERLRAEGIRVDVRTLFEMPTIAELLSMAGSYPHVAIPPNLIPQDCEAITPQMLTLVDLVQDEIDCVTKSVIGGARNIQEIYPLAPLQEGILFHHLLGGEGDPYLLAGLLSFDSRILLDSYVRAMQAVIDRHDILRTALVWENLRQPVQVVWKKAVLAIEEVEVQDTCGDMAEQFYERFSPRRYRIDIKHAPLLRAYVAHDQRRKRWLMVLLIHHLIGDHTTVEVMQEEIRAHLSGHLEHLPEPLPFRNLVAEARLGISGKEHEAFFKRMLADVTEGTHPFGLKDVQGDGRGIEEARIQLDQKLAQRIRRQAQELAVSSASICHLAWARVAAKLSGRDDVVFGTVLFGRMLGAAVADRALGLFINTLPFRFEVKNEGVRASVRKTHRMLTELLRHEHASLMLAQSCSGVPAPAPLFTALLNYAHTPRTTQELPEKGLLELKAWEGMEWLISQERSNYPFTLTVDDLGEGFGLSAQTMAAIDPRRVCGYMQTVLESLMEALEEDPDRPVWELEVLPANERQQVLYGWNNRAGNRPVNHAISHLFEEQARRISDMVAVADAAAMLSYGELNRRANQLAHYLRGLGVKPDVRVGVCSEDAIQTAVAFVAVLKAGGAYVLLDPSSSIAQLQSRLTDCGAALLLMQGMVKKYFEELQTSLTAVDLNHAFRWKDELETNPDPSVNGENVACVAYSCCDAGQPEGLMMTHSNIVRVVRSLEPPQPASKKSITQFSCSGSASATIEIWSALLSGGRLAYESAKPTVSANCKRTQSPGEINTVIVRPAANARFYLLDRHGDPAANGVESDLYLAGAGLPRGYLGHPKITAERFVPDPFCADLGERMYCAGGQGKWHGNGEVEISERNCEKTMPIAETPAEQGQLYEPPRGEIESALASIWTEVLKVSRVGRYDSFFALGGRSLMAVQVASRVRQVLGAELTIRDIFEHSTLRNLAEQIINLKLSTFDSEQLTELLKECKRTI
jgi:amino acid adenylation domain-containing protein